MSCHIQPEPDVVAALVQGSLLSTCPRQSRFPRLASHQNLVTNARSKVLASTLSPRLGSDRSTILARRPEHTSPQTWVKLGPKILDGRPAWTFPQTWLNWVKSARRAGRVHFPPNLGQLGPKILDGRPACTFPQTWLNWVKSCRRAG